MARNTSVFISKLLSLMLRHRPDEFGLTMDPCGFVNLDDVVQALQSKDASIVQEDVESVVYDGEKQRFEIVDGRIRARYGHSFYIELGVDPSEPPEFLYKGVDSSETDTILAEGMKPHDRNYLHLSFEANVAEQLSSRPGRQGAVIRIEALRAHQAGVEFFDCGPTILTGSIPSEFLALESPGTVAAGGEDTAKSDDGDKPVSYGRRRRFGSRR